MYAVIFMVEDVEEGETFIEWVLAQKPEMAPVVLVKDEPLEASKLN